MTENSNQIPRLKYYTVAGFFVIGVVTVLLGQILPILSSRLGLNDAQAGTFFLAQFSGSIAGTLAATRIARRSGWVLTTLFGIGMMVLGLPGLNFGDFFLCWVAIFVYGVGLGLTIPAINLLTIEATPVAEQTSMINLINFAWGVGAIVSRPFVALVSDGDSLVTLSISLDVALILLAAFYFSLHRAFPVRVSTDAEPPPPRIWNRPSSWLFILFGFFCIGIETGLGGWLTTYSESLRRADEDVVNAAVVFFSFLVLGRGLASVIARRMSENVLISICAVILLTGISLIVAGESTAILGAALAGLGTSAIFPTNMVRFTRIFGPEATRSATPLFIAGVCGGASLSWLIGVVSTQYASLRIGIVVLLFAAIAVLFLQVAIVICFRKPAV